MRLTVDQCLEVSNHYHDYVVMVERGDFKGARTKVELMEKLGADTSVLDSELDRMMVGSDAR